MNSLEALLLDMRKARGLRGRDLGNQDDEMSASRIAIQKLSKRFGTMPSGIASVNHKMSPCVILIRSKKFG
jgi:hypothetical protein